LCLASCVEVVFVGERSCVLLVVFAQILSGGSLCGKSCVDDIVEILLCDGEDVEQWLVPRNVSCCLRLIHYLLLSLIYLALIHIVHIILICLVLFVCASLVLNQESFTWHLNSYLEEIVQSPSPGIRLHFLVTLSVLYFSFNSALFVIRLAIHLFAPLWVYLHGEPVTVLALLVTVLMERATTDEGTSWHDGESASADRAPAVSIIDST